MTLPARTTVAAYSVVVPTVGRPSLGRLLAALESGRGPLPDAVILVDDRRTPGAPLPIVTGPRLADRVRVLQGSGRGPAAARNVGWRATATPWVAFLDDDVLPQPDWPTRLVADLADLPPDVAGSQGRIVVPLPSTRPATDWERGTAGLASACWATADMAYRRDVLVRVDGFDERFPRAYREDADLALRVLDAGYGLVRGSRMTRHPVRPADRWVSVRAQAGNCDDALMRRLHGRSWRGRAGAAHGRLARHLVIVGAGGLAVAAGLARRPRLAAAAALGWLAGTAEFAAARVRPGPRDRDEVATMLLTSVVIPPVAAYHRVRGMLARWPAVPRRAPRRPAASRGLPPPAATDARRRGRCVAGGEDAASGPAASGPAASGPAAERTEETVSRRVLVARLDSDGDVLLAGPAVRAVAAGAGEVVLLVGPRGRQAAELLPGVTRTVVWSAPWVDPEPGPVRPDDVATLIAELSAFGFDTAVLLTSHHQSPLPLALLLRLAGVRRTVAISEDYPGSLLDVRHRVDGDPPEVERNLSLAVAAGFRLPPGDDGRLRLRGPLPDVRRLIGPEPYLVVHPGASVPARAWSPDRCAEAVDLLARRGHRVLVTGSPAERPLTARVAGGAGVDLGGRTSFAELAAVLAGAGAVVVGNTGPAHLAAAVGTAVVSLFAPVVPASRWAPYGVPIVLLGDQDAACRNSRARRCPVPGHPCLDRVTAAEVSAAVDHLLAGQPGERDAPARGVCAR